MKPARASVGYARRASEDTLALLYESGELLATRWERAQSPVDGRPVVDVLSDVELAGVAVTGWGEMWPDRVEDEAVRRVIDYPGAQRVSPVQALAAWAARVTGARRLRLLVANRRSGSACLLMEEGRPSETDLLPAGRTVFDLYARVAARGGWETHAERMQWFGLYSGAAAAELPAPVSEANPLLLDVDSALGAMQRLSAAERAVSAQALLEDRVGRLLSRWQREDESATIALSGDYAYNALLVRSLERAGVGVRVPFAAGEHALAPGAAVLASGEEARGPALDNPFLGPSFDEQQIKDVIDNCRLHAKLLSRAELIGRALQEIAENRIVGWFQGRAELGPRTLGARSILANPRMPFLRENLNVYVKNREMFRPFALSMPEESAPAVAECTANCLYMASLARPFEPLAEIAGELLLPNGELRLHLVRQRVNPLFHQLLQEMEAMIGLPAVVNTSFNSPGMPVVATPRDAIRTFFSHGIDTLFLGRWMIAK
jgi:hypothetical protein